MDVVISIVTNAAMLKGGLTYLLNKPLALRLRILNAFVMLEKCSVNRFRVWSVVGVRKYQTVFEALALSVRTSVRSDVEVDAGCASLEEIDAVDKPDSHGDGDGGFGAGGAADALRIAAIVGRAPNSCPPPI
ncbi:MAG: hypothetical protein VW891_10360, partial [Novosphingobium sp.]